MSGFLRFQDKRMFSLCKLLKFKLWNSFICQGVPSTDNIQLKGVERRAFILLFPPPNVYYTKQLPYNLITFFMEYKYTYRYM